MGIGFRNAKKVVGRTPGYLPYTVPNWDGGSNEWKIELNINKKIHTDPKVYKGKEALAKMYEYYKYYYDKYRN